MQVPALSHDEDKLMRFALARARQTSKGVPKKEFDKEFRGESETVLERLRQRQLLRASGLVFFPTVHGLLFEREKFADIFAFIEQVIGYGHRILNSSDPSNSVKVDVIAAEIARSSVLPLEDPGFRLLFDCALYGLDPFIQVVSEMSGKPNVIQFTPSLFRIASLDDLLRKQEEIQKAVAAIPMGMGGIRMEPAISGIPMEPATKGQAGPPNVGRLADLLSKLQGAYEQNEPLRDILRRDAQEVEACRREKAYKAVLLLCGSVLEGALVDILNRRPDLASPSFTKLHKGRFPEDASLRDLLNLATAKLHDDLEPLLGPATKRLSETVIDHRDLIHPHREVRGAQLRIDQDTAEHLYSTLCIVLGNMDTAISDGWLERYTGI